jgi:flagellar basal body P-ring protein FlgI
LSALTVPLRASLATARIAAAGFDADPLDAGARRGAWSRRDAMRLGLAAPLLACFAGCATPAVNLQSPEDELDLLDESVKLVGDHAVAYGLHPLKVESVALITKLPSTGSDPPPSILRAALVDELQIRGVEHPNELLKSPTTALVLVTGYIRPGIRKGDHFDVAVQCQPRDGTTSLRGGWLMEARLTELAVDAGNNIREGRQQALAQGNVLVDPAATDKDKDRLRAGRVLGGGIATRSRDLGLLLKAEHKSSRLSDQIGKSINARFFSYEQGTQQGVANAKTDQYIELRLHPRYKDNIARYVSVVRAVAVRESGVERSRRMRLLERQLLDPIDSERAALKLEAIGVDAVDILAKGLKSNSAEVRFYAAEALAYLLDGDSQYAPVAAGILAEIALSEPAFRAYALAALCAMKDVSAYDQLRKLQDVPSAETRYGAFRALWTRDPNDPYVRGVGLSGQLSFHELDAAGPPMIHVTNSFRPEIVLFGKGQRLGVPCMLETSKSLTVHGESEDRVTVARYVLDRPPQKRVVGNTIEAVARAIAEVGGTYGDVLQVLMQAKAKGMLATRLEVDALPQTGRTYYRKSQSGEGPTGDGPTADGAAADDHADGGHSDASGDRSSTVASPTPDLFAAPPDKRHAGKGKPKAGGGESAAETSETDASTSDGAEVGVEPEKN